MMELSSGERITIDLDVLNKYTTKKNFDQFLDWLHETHQEWTRDGDVHFNLVSAAETFLQACGVEGYEWS